MNQLVWRLEKEWPTTLISLEEPLQCLSNCSQSLLSMMMVGHFSPSCREMVGKDSFEYALYPIITYSGTPATVSQMAKDVSVFLRWASGKYICVRHWLLGPSDAEQAMTSNLFCLVYDRARAWWSQENGDEGKCYIVRVQLVLTTSACRGNQATKLVCCFSPTVYDDTFCVAVCHILLEEKQVDGSEEPEDSVFR